MFISEGLHSKHNVLHSQKTIWHLYIGIRSCLPHRRKNNTFPLEHCIKISEVFKYNPRGNYQQLSNKWICAKCGTYSNNRLLNRVNSDYFGNGPIFLLHWLHREGEGNGVAAPAITLALLSKHAVWWRANVVNTSCTVHWKTLTHKKYNMIANLVSLNRIKTHDMCNEMFLLMSYTVH